MDPAPANSSSSSSSAKKNKLDEDVRTYCEIIARCSLPDVAKWKDEDLERAFRWSGYFRQVHSRCLQRASLMEKFDKRFREIGSEGGWRFAGEAVSCAFLGTSQEYLTKALLENPALPVSLREEVLHRYADSEGREASDALLKHLTEVDSCRQLLGVLQAVHIKVKEHAQVGHPDCSPQPGLVSVNAMCLLKDIHWLLSLRQGKQEPGLVSSVETVVHKKLQSLVHETKGGLDVVLHSLLLSPDGKSEEGALEVKQTTLEALEDDRKIILDWLLQELNSKLGESLGSKLNCFQRRLFAECSPDLLATVSLVHSSFFTEYIKLLMGKAEEIEQSTFHNIINHNPEAPEPTPMETDCNTTLDLPKGSSDCKLLLDHFRKLTRSRGQDNNYKEICVALLKSKIQPPIAVKYHLPPMVGTIWNKILHAVLINNEIDESTEINDR